MIWKTYGQASANWLPDTNCTEVCYFPSDYGGNRAPGFQETSALIRRGNV